MEGTPDCYSFDRVAAEYESTRFLPESITERIAALLTEDLETDDWLLDAGVGTGRIGRAVAAQHVRTVGIDISTAMLTQMQMPPFPHRVQGDLRNLPFADATFRRVLSVHIFHLLPHWQQALAEVWRVLCPCGMLWIGFEERSRTRVREHYLQLARQRGVLPPRIGANATQLTDTLEAWGAVVQRREPPQLIWERPLRIATTLAMIERRTYSLLWDIPETVHREMLTETTQWATTELGGPDAIETPQNQFIFYTATKLP